jgi:hypothetical protein
MSVEDSISRSLGTGARLAADIRERFPALASPGEEPTSETGNSPIRLVSCRVGHASLLGCLNLLLPAHCGTTFGEKRWTTQSLESFSYVCNRELAREELVRALAEWTMTPLPLFAIYREERRLRLAIKLFLEDPPTA